MLTHLSRLSLRTSLPLLLGLFALLFTLLQTTLYLPRSIDKELHAWRSHTNQLLVLLQSTLSDHLRHGRQAELEAALADFASLQGIRWAMVADPQLRVLATTRLGLGPRQLGITAEQVQAQLTSGHPTWLERAGQHYLAILPLDQARQPSGESGEALLVDLDLSPLLSRTRLDAWLYLGQILALLLLLGLLLNHLYHHLIVRRLAHIDRATRRFAADQQPQSAAVDGHDEIGQLAETVSQMMGQLHERRQALQDSAQLMRELFDSSPVGMLVLDGKRRAQQVNPAAAALFGCAPEDLLGRRPRERLLKGDALKRLLRAPANTPVELSGLYQGRELPLEVTWTPFTRDGARHYLLLLRDIGERLQAEQRLRFLAHFDPLTHLANRHGLIQHLERLLAANAPLSLLFLDIDHFKRINDTLGHEVGDRLLVEIARRLTRLAPKQVLVARFGGDEFLLLLEERSAGQARKLAETLLQGFKAPLQIGQYECFVTPSIGIAGFDGQGSASELLKQADLALHAAKDAGRNRLAVYSHPLGEAAEHRLQLEQELRHALDQREFVLHYQAQVDEQGRPQVMEALLRWQSPSRGLVLPGEFIPVLEETGMIIETTRWVFREACRQARRWAEQGHPLRIAVNLSPLDFRQADLAGSLLGILAEEQLPPGLLELEITESALLDAGQEVQRALARLKAAGLPLLLDDFGTGYASLTYLQQFPFDGIKIDRQFVAGLPESEHSVALVRGILTMARHLGLHVVAEGVSNERQAAFLRRNSCPSLQGYYYCRPQTAAAIERGWSQDAPRSLLPQDH
ncbi:putative bifunctional diguanylate cyclase/phosphodiesterase [Azotobacter beijerinckii]|uniref:PAS domain S-box-containing protein/diguanylate cyclase (GGDEF) domain-containing protein n=1 Tax=Azotobacter beijerinckii TaxID=170623 RepID=A0A1I4B8S7_9GAMM|nr:EAL domain-containing protein [Azotobacter beijerinckii]SFB05066.1 PAS domain S-box-containing protein/diguanylate cyclase (GGDEF) domain-containing protein [Azotobacter beijerinckii]SFK65215.1 PAS domain S-box-containing protein/diguanylate cyclase (GGDEF) domain-containing protein [Azotobacter beijerinckii]